jgi:EAL domain-containing protein (putative c-di-GMP-specific phosphodiesterase class I)/DNA-binding CsgD family transcriptional regulator
VVEASGELMDAVSAWLIGVSINAYNTLRSQGILSPIALNLSSQSFHDLTFPERLTRRLEEAAVPTSHLVLEISETTVLRDVDRITDVLTRLRVKGIGLAIDDFGSGYSSFKLLRELPYSEIKIDKSFVTDAAASDDSLKISKSIIDLAVAMGMTSVAVGVETEKVAELFEHLNVGAIQGRFIAPGMPVEAVPSWFQMWAAGGRRMSTSVIVDELVVADALAAPSTGAVRGALADQSANPRATPGPVTKLSPRQMDVMRLLSQGRSVKDIARRLDLGVGTVKVHLALAYTALGAHNRVEAVLRAGLISDSSDENTSRVPP